MSGELNEEGFPIHAGVPEPKPGRIRLSRHRGYHLQTQSRAINGLAAVNVSRVGVWGNPFVVNPKAPSGAPAHGWPAGSLFVPTAAVAVARFRGLMADPGQMGAAFREGLPELRGKNLACWCQLDAPCHADVLLALANA